MSDIANLVSEVWDDLLNKDDRTSPPEHPDMVLITRNELADALSLAQFNWNEQRTHGIDIQDLRDLDGGAMGFWAKGHHPTHRFAEACNHYTGADAYYDRRHVTPDQCRHEWWRTVPVGGEPGMVQYLPAEPKSRGAFAVTVTTVIEDRDRRQTQREIDQHNKGRAAGFADGLNWALHQLDRINHEAGAELLRHYREENKKGGAA